MATAEHHLKGVIGDLIVKLAVAESDKDDLRAEIEKLKAELAAAKPRRTKVDA